MKRTRKQTLEQVSVEPDVVPTQANESNDRFFVTALARGLAVLQTLATAQEPRTVSQLSRMVGLPQPTVWRLCHTLHELGYIERVSEDHLRPGIKALALGYSTLANRTLVDLAKPQMTLLANRFSGAVSLGVECDAKMLYIARVESREPVFPGLRPGSTVSMLTTGMGWAYLGALDTERRTNLLEKACKMYPEEHARAYPLIEKALVEYRSQGFVTNMGIFHPELNAVGAPVINAQGEVLAALSCGGHRSLFTQKILAEQVGPALRDFGNDLGVLGMNF